MSTEFALYLIGTDHYFLGWAITKKNPCTAKLLEKIIMQGPSIHVQFSDAQQILVQAIAHQRRSCTAYGGEKHFMPQKNTQPPSKKNKVRPLVYFHSRLQSRE